MTPYATRDLSFPRRRESRLPFVWIPACAGMTWGRGDDWGARVGDPAAFWRGMTENGLNRDSKTIRTYVP